MSAKTRLLRLRVDFGAPASASPAQAIWENGNCAMCLPIYPVTLFLEESKEEQGTQHSHSFNYRNSQDQFGSY